MIPKKYKDKIIEGKNVYILKLNNLQKNYHDDFSAVENSIINGVIIDIKSNYFTVKINDKDITLSFLNKNLREKTISSFLINYFLFFSKEDIYSLLKERQNKDKLKIEFEKYVNKLDKIDADNILNILSKYH